MEDLRGTSQAQSRMRRLLVVAGTALATGCLASAALAHVERTAYWPDPRPDTTVNPAAGGKVPTARSLASAGNPRARGNTRVVCQPNSMQLLSASVAAAQRSGVQL